MIAIHAEGLTKQYRIEARREKYATLRDTLVNTMSAPIKRLRAHSNGAHGNVVYALKDVSFEVKHGEVLGIIGRNGAGKSTLLKILSSITEPTAGYVDVYGRVGSLLEVGTGFHPELSGRENIYLNGAILGMRRAEIDRKFDEIVAFSEIEPFIETPVKHYSSGMYMRLAFAVAAHLEPEILIVDEVLAVGDAAFQQKCLGKMDDVAQKGRTVLFVSHNMTAMQTLCQRVMLLEKGRVVEDGDATTVIQRYLQSDARQGEMIFDDETVRTGGRTARFTAIRLMDEEGRPVSSVPMGKGLIVEMQFMSERRLSSPNFSVRLHSPLIGDIAAWRTQETHGAMPPVHSGGTVSLHIDDLNLMPGMYYLTLSLSDGNEQLDFIDTAVGFEITPWPIYSTGKLPSARRSIIFTRCSWQPAYT